MPTPNGIKMKTSIFAPHPVGRILNIEVQVKGKDKLKDFAAMAAKVAKNLHSLNDYL